MAIELKELTIAKPILRPLYKIYFWSKNDEVPVWDFLDQLQPEDFSKFVAQLERIVEHGLPKSNCERYKQLHGYDNLHELKLKPARYFFFIDEQKLIFTEAYSKKKDSTERTVTDRADRRRREYYKKGV